VNLPSVFLLLSALTFAAFGVAFLVAPVAMIGLVELGASSPTARAEVRAMYGGLELGIAAFLFACLARRERVAAGLLCSTIALAGLALARGASIVLDGPVEPIMYWLAAAEVGGVVMSAVGWRLAVRSAAASD
jgi:hypothetical protein